ncbi:HmuY family protein [uncultured Fibrella sp.]|uniref:HmuY family protein n=1 Tax=uncultured Fibrella sp. TaxID=1284596 RepID=UPI0035CC5AD3
MKITYHVLLITASLATTIACKKEDAAQPVVPVQAQTVTNLPADPTTGVNPTTGQPLGTTGKYTFYNLRDNKTVANTDSASNKWDIGFRGTSVIINGGPIRSGQGGAYVYTGTFEQLTTVPTSATFAQDQTSGLAIPAVSGSGWYNYNSSTNIVTPIPGRVLVIRTGDGKYAKLEVLSYYENAPAAPVATSRSRFYTFRYVYQPDGSTKLN